MPIIPLDYLDHAKLKRVSDFTGVPIRTLVIYAIQKFFESDITLDGVNFQVEDILKFADAKKFIDFKTAQVTKSLQEKISKK